MLAVGAGGGWYRHFYSPLYCLKGPLNPKQPTNQPFAVVFIHSSSSPYSNRSLTFPMFDLKTFRFPVSHNDKQSHIFVFIEC